MAMTIREAIEQDHEYAQQSRREGAIIRLGELEARVTELETRLLEVYQKTYAALGSIGFAYQSPARYQIMDDLKAAIRCATGERAEVE